MDEPRVTDYRVPLEGEEDFLRVHLIIHESRVIGLVIQYEAIIDDELVEVVRYDTSHGFLHRHRFWLQSKNQTDDLEDPKRPARDYTEQVTWPGTTSWQTGSHTGCGWRKLFANGKATIGGDER